VEQEENGNDDAMDAIPPLLQTMASRVNKSIANIDDLPKGCSPLENPIWRAVGHLYAHPCSNRLFGGLGEFALATDIVVPCGSRQVIWDDFSDPAKEAVRLGIQSLARGRREVVQVIGDSFASIAHSKLSERDKLGEEGSRK
jgi:hypothetical protein